MMQPVLLVLPCYHDSERLTVFLPELCKVFADQKTVRFIVVDDGSGAAEVIRLQALLDRLNGQFDRTITLVALEKNLGKGGAVYAGWERATPNESWLAFADADGAINASEVRRLIGFAQTSGIDAALASRVKMLGHHISRSIYRHVLGRVFATFASAITGLDVYDSQCGCKVIRQSDYQKIRQHLFEYRFGFDMDLLVNLHRSRANIAEVPIDWKDVPGSKIAIIRDGWRMFQTLWHLRKSKFRNHGENRRLS